MNFDEFSDEMFRRHAAGQYAAALEWVEGGLARFVDQLPTLRYWQICLTARVNNLPRALQLLQAALAGGDWFAPELLRGDADLAALQGQPEFERCVAECEVRLRATTAAPRLFTYAPDPAAGPLPLLFALHGNFGSAAQTLGRWQPAVAAGWLLALPQSAQVLGPERYGWRDYALAQTELLAHRAAVLKDYPVDEARVVLGGFSRGGETVLRLALSGALKARGVIAVVPGGPFIMQPDLWRPLLELGAAPALKVALWIGERDASRAGTEALAAQLEASGITCRWQVCPDLGHAFPPDFAAALPAALDFIVAE